MTRESLRIGVKPITIVRDKQRDDQKIPKYSEVDL